MDASRIDQRRGLVDGLAEVRVGDGRRHHEIDGPLKQRLEALEQAKVGVVSCQELPNEPGLRA